MPKSHKPSGTEQALTALRDEVVSLKDIVVVVRDDVGSLKGTVAMLSERTGSASNMLMEHKAETTREHKLIVDSINRLADVYDEDFEKLKSRTEKIENRLGLSGTS